MVFPKKPSKVWKVAEAEDWNELEIVLSDRREAVPKTRRPLSEASSKVPLLSYVIWKDAPKAIVEAIVKKCPQAAEIEDTKGRLPLHIACICKRSPGIVDLLLDNDHRSVVYPDKQGYIPLHHAVEVACKTDPASSLDMHLDVLSSLLVAHPASVVVPNQEGDTALAMAKRRDKTSARVVFNMLACTNKTFNTKKRFSISEDFTFGSSSLLDFESSLSLTLEEDEEDGSDSHVVWDNERQAMGERPQRRNGFVNILPITSTN